MKVALIGAGRIGQLHARNLVATPGVDGVIVADADTDRAAAVAGEVGATAAPSIETALDMADAVVVAATTTAHADLTRAAIGRGLPTFCEKPLAADLDATLAVAAEIERSGVPFQLGFQRRFDPGYREARRLVDSGELGVLYAVRLDGHDPAPPPEAYIPVSGGLFRDFSTHDFDILRWLTGCEVEEVYADGGVRRFAEFARYDDVDTGVATMRMVDGPFVTLTSVRHDPRGYDIRTELFGSLDNVAVGLGPRMPTHSAEPDVPAPRRPGLGRLLRPVRVGLPRRVRGLRRHGPGRGAQPVHRRGRRGGPADRRGGDPLAPRTSPDPARGHPRRSDRLRRTPRRS